MKDENRKNKEKVKNTKRNKNKKELETYRETKKGTDVKQEECKTKRGGRKKVQKIKINKVRIKTIGRRKQK